MHGQIKYREFAFQMIVALAVSPWVRASFDVKT